MDDEIQMGFYRAGKFWALENFNVEPDIIVFGKALTNGLNPLSGIWAREEPDQSRDISAGLNAFDVLIEYARHRRRPRGRAHAGGDRLRGRLVRRKGAYFLAQIQQLQQKFPKVIGDTDGMGLALRIEICQEDGYTPDRELTDRIFAEGMKGDLDAHGERMGLVLDVGGYYKNVFTLAPSFTMTEADIDLSVNLLEQLIRRCAPGRV